MNNEIYFHIGYPRTATTLIQKIFSNNNNVAMIGRPYIVSSEFEKFLDELFNINAFDYNKNYFIKWFNNLIEKYRDQIKGKKILISYENIFGEKFNQFNEYYSLNRLFDVFNDCKIILTIRKQDQIIESMYRMYIENGGTLHIREYMYKYNGPTSDIYKKHRSLEKFNYYNIVKHCYKKVGSEKTLIVPFEIDKKIIINKIENFMDIDITNPYIMITNSSFSYFGIQILKILNNFLSTPSNSQILFRTYKPNIYNFLIKKIFIYLDKSIFKYIFNKKKYIDKRNNFIFQNYLDFLLNKFSNKKIKVNYFKNERIRDTVINNYSESNSKLDKLIESDLKKLQYY